MAQALAMENCVTLRPSMADFEHELEFLKSAAVQDAGKRCGIVRVVTPREFSPSTEQYDEVDKAQNGSLWVNQVPVLEQRFLELEEGPGRGKPGMYVVGRRQDEPYPLSTEQWQDEVLKWKGITEKSAIAGLRKEKRDKAYQLPSDPRQRYWVTRPYQNVAFYGADIPQSVMRKDQKCWNFDSPDFPCLTQMFTTERTPGVYTPYLYIGSWGSTFGLHPEDKDLYSLNYLHEGDSKFWYGMASSDSARVEAFASELLPDESSVCGQFLRHKTLLIEPHYYLDRGIPVFTAEQKQGDLMITFPNAYHYGFNSGFNVAEARNIATEDWIEWGLKAKHCTCPVYNGADVLPRERIVQMALHCNPTKYAYLTKPHRPSDVAVTEPESGDGDDTLIKRVKRARRI